MSSGGRPFNAEGSTADSQLGIVVRLRYSNTPLAAHSVWAAVLSLSSPRFLSGSDVSRERSYGPSASIIVVAELTSAKARVRRQDASS